MPPPGAGSSPSAAAMCGRAAPSPAADVPGTASSLDVEVVDALGARHALQLRDPAPSAAPGVRLPGAGGVWSTSTKASGCVSNLVDVEPDEIRIGMPVQAEFVPTDGDHHVPVFRRSPSAHRLADERAGIRRRRRDRRHRTDRVLPRRRPHRAAARVRVDRRGPRATPGFTPADVDGLVSYTIDPVEETELVRSVGFPEIGFSSPDPVRRRRFDGHAVARGERGRQSVPPTSSSPIAPSGPAPARPASGAPRRLRARPRRTPARPRCSGAMPYGVLTPASWMALNSTRYMHEFGVTQRGLRTRRGAAARVRRDAIRPRGATSGPITLEDHQESRWIAEPCIHLLDCCQETDGSVALVITSAERAADLRNDAGAHRRRERRRAVRAGDRLRPLPPGSLGDGRFGRARRAGCSTGSRFRRDDIDVAMIYDAFSPILLMQLEALGFCGRGEAKDFVADGDLGTRRRAAVQHQRRPHRRGLHPRAEPRARSDAPACAAPR